MGLHRIHFFPIDSLDVEDRELVKIQKIKHWYVASLCWLILTPLLASDPDQEAVLVHPFQNKNTWQNSPSKLLLSNSHDFAASVQSFLRSKIDRSDIDMNVKRLATSSLGLAQNSKEVLEFNFSHAGIPLCLGQVKAVNVAGQVALFGDIPQVEEGIASSPDWPDLSQSMRTSENYAYDNMRASDAKIFHFERCFYVVQKTLVPVWNMILQMDGRAYRVWADEDSVYKWQNLYFDLDATTPTKIQAYARDLITNADPQVFTENTYGKGVMANDYFATDPSTSESNINRASSTDNTFIYEPNNEFFSEASLFVHANNHFAYFASLGYGWTEAKPITIKFHALVGSTKNNAMYQPVDSETGKPSIDVGDGDGVVLQNLTTDSDVVSHEFGHHVIFHTIQSTDGESLILHEGLADFFVMARNQDPCLGHSICVSKTSGGCVVPGECLRSAAVSLAYKDDNYQSYEAHYRSQVVSGVLYDLWQSIDSKNVASLAYSALEMMASNSGIKHFLLGVMLADYQINSGKNACTIYNAAVARGFSSLLTDVDCSNLDSVKTAEKNANLDATPSAPQSSKSKKKGILGCMGLSHVEGPFSIDLGMLLIFLPYLLLGRRRSKKHS